MSTVTTTRPINQRQLSDEIVALYGGQPKPMRLVGPDPEGSTVVTVNGVGEANLTAAIEAHVADPGYTDPRVAAEAANIAALQQKMLDLVEDAATAIGMLQTIRDTPQATFTTLAQAQSQVRTLQDQVKTIALVSQEHMRRSVALARVTLGLYSDPVD